MSPFCLPDTENFVGIKQVRFVLIAMVLLVSSNASSAGRRSVASPSAGVATANETRFLSVPDPVSAERHMKILAAEPHVAGTPEDYKTAQYVAQRFREAGLDTSIVEYKVWLNYPAEVSVVAFGPRGVIMHGPTPEQVDDDPYQNRPHVMPAFSG